MRIIKLVFCLLLATAVYSQEGQFSQYFASSLFLNPGYAGLISTINLSTNYKRSDQSVDGSFHELYQVSFTYPLQKITSLKTQSGGVGITASNEKVGIQGLYQTTKVMLNGSYVLPFDRLGTRKLSFGLQGGVVQNKLNYDDLRFGSQYNPYYGYDNILPSESVDFSPNFFPVFNVGAIFSIVDHYNPILQQNTMQVGLSIDYLNQPRYGFLVTESGKNLRRPMILKLVGTSKFGLSTRFFMHPSVLIITNQDNYQINIGDYFSTYLDSNLNTLLQVGAWYRVADSFIFLTGIQYKHINLGISFDLNSKAINPNEVIYQNSFQPSYEVSLSYTFDFSSGPINVLNPLF